MTQPSPGSYGAGPPEPGQHAQMPPHPQNGGPPLAARYPTQPPAVGQPNPYPKNWMGIVALVAPLLVLMVPLAPIAGIVFGHLAMAANKRGEADNKGLARAGLVLSYFITVGSILFVIASIVFQIGFAFRFIESCDPDPVTGECQGALFQRDAELGDG